MDWKVGLVAVRMLGCVLAIPAGAAAAQGVPFSQHGVVTQRVSHTDIEVTYNRPTARGRVLFGADSPAVVRFGKLWHPGADSATRIHVSRQP